MPMTRRKAIRIDDATNGFCSATLCCARVSSAAMVPRMSVSVFCKNHVATTSGSQLANAEKTTYS